MLTSQKTVLSVKLLLSQMSRLVGHSVQTGSGDCAKSVLEHWKEIWGKGDNICLFCKAAVKFSVCDAYPELDKYNFPKPCRFDEVHTILDIIVKDKKYSAWFLPRLSLVLLL